MSEGRKKRGRFICFLLCLIVSVSMACPVYAAKGKVQKIKVAITGCQNFLEMDENGAVTGYAKEYLDEIADYTGWTYEYEKMSLSDALEALQEGKIDLVPGLQKSEQREGLFDFSTYNMGETTTILCVRSDDDKYYYNDFANYDGMVVGELKSSSCGELLQKEAKSSGSHVVLKEYESENALHQALEQGKVDAITYSRLHRTPDYKMIASFHPSYLYFGLNLKNTKLKGQIDEAMKRIFEDSPYFSSKLDTEFYENVDMNLSLSKEEQDYVNAHDTITVALSKDLSPMEFYDEDSGTFEGFTVKYFDLLSKKTGLKFRYVSREDIDTLKKQGKNQDVQMVGIMAVDGVASLIGADETDSPYSNTLSLIQKVSHKNNVEKDSLGIMAGYPYFRQTAEELGYKKIKEYDSARECAIAVKRGKIDAAMVSSVAVSMILNHAYFDNLTSVELSETKISYCFGVFQSKDSKTLLNIINKGVRNLPEEDVKKARMSALMSYQAEPTLIDRVYENKMFLLFFGCLVILTIFIIVTKRKSRERAKEIQRLFEYVCHANKYVIEYDLKK